MQKNTGCLKMNQKTKKQIEEKKNKSGKTIKIVIYLYTSHNKKQLPKKHAVPYGKVSLPTNRYHGIRASDEKDPCYFSPTQGTMHEAIKKCLNQHNIKILKKDEISNFLKTMEKENFFDENVEF